MGTLNNARCSDEEFIEIWNQLQSGTRVAEALSVAVRAVLARRRRIERDYQIELKTAQEPPPTSPPINQIKQQLNRRIQETRHHVRRGITLEKGRAIIFSDAHFYPDTDTTAFQALIESIKEFQPEVIICNGDAFDGTSISRHARINWGSVPSVIEELDAVKHYLGEIEKASKFKSNLIWTLGNHDARFESYLSNNVPQFSGVDGFSLSDHFPIWKPCWSYFINNDCQIKHRWKGGKFGGANNTLHSGVHIATGHTHVLSVDAYTDHSPNFQNGTRYGIQTGTLADPKGNQFIDYCEDNPVNWRSGFVLMTWHKSQLLMPEMVQVWDEEEGEVQFRGKVHKV